MFDRVLITPLNTITIFFPDVSTLKLMTFWFFSTINFSYQYLSEAKAYLEPSRTSTMEFFCENLFCKIDKKTLLPESLFNNVTVSILWNSRSEVLCEKGVLKICSKFTGECPCRSAISIKLLCNFIETHCAMDVLL